MLKSVHEGPINRPALVDEWRHISFEGVPLFVVQKLEAIRRTHVELLESDAEDADFTARQSEALQAVVEVMQVCREVEFTQQVTLLNAVACLAFATIRFFNHEPSTFMYGYSPAAAK